MGKRLGTYLKVAREKTNISQAELATELKLGSAQSISNIERGLAPLPRAKVQLVAKILGLAKYELINLIVDEIREKYFESCVSDRREKKTSKKKLSTTVRKPA